MTTGCDDGSIVIWSRSEKVFETGKNTFETQEKVFEEVK